MKASVIIPVYNTGVLLRRMLDSVLAQTERDIELICVDDGSTDGSDAVVEEYAAKDERVRLIRQKNQGPYVARSTGLMAAKGDYVYICDHDDRLHPQLLEFCIYQLEKHGMGIIVFGHENRMEQGDFEMPGLRPFDEIDVKILDNNVLRTDRACYLSSLCSVHIDQWAHVAKRELAQSVLCRADYNLPRTLDLIKHAGRWGWTDLKLYYYNVGNPQSLVKKPPTRKVILDLDREMVGLINLFGDTIASGDCDGVWGAVLRSFLIPNVKMMYNSIRRGRKALLNAGRLDECLQLFAILLYDIFVLRGISMGAAKLQHRLIYRMIMWKYRPDLSESWEALTARVASNKSRFEALTRSLAYKENDEDILSGAETAIAFQMSHSTGYYSSTEIEEALLKVARRHTVSLPSEYKKNSILHVMTRYMEVGGHTRVVERWIARSSLEELHSVAVLSPSGEPPPYALRYSVESHHGDIIQFDSSSSTLQKALDLRKLASSFERVILHVNCEDMVPILAFGTEDFQRPVFLFNHADHVFGLGVSIADAFIDFRKLGAVLSRNYRGVSNSCLLALPYDDRTPLEAKGDRDAIRASLDIRPGQKVIVSAASAYKYHPFLQWNFVDYMESVLDLRQDVRFIIIGPKKAYGKIRHRDRINALGLVSPDELARYFVCADLVVDSLPFGSGLTLQDAVSIGAPILSLETIAGKMDYVEESSAYAHSIEELVDMTCRILDNPEYADSVRKDVTSRLQVSMSREKWLKDIGDIYKCAVRHKVRSFVSVPRTPFDQSDLFIEAQHLHMKEKFNFAGIASIVSYRKNGRKRHSFKLGLDCREKRGLS